LDFRVLRDDIQIAKAMVLCAGWPTKCGELIRKNLQNNRKIRERAKKDRHGRQNVMAPQQYFSQ